MLTLPSYPPASPWCWTHWRDSSIRRRIPTLLRSWSWRHSHCSGWAAPLKSFNNYGQTIQEGLDSGPETAWDMEEVKREGRTSRRARQAAYGVGSL